MNMYLFLCFFYSCVSWMSTAGQGFSLQYPAISLHAISKDLSAFPHECLYLMVDGDLGGRLGSDHTYFLVLSRATSLYLRFKTPQALHCFINMLTLLLNIIQMIFFQFTSIKDLCMACMHK